jgi:hypothetical protein
MKTKVVLLACAAALSMTTTAASAATATSPMMTRSAMTRPTPRHVPRVHHRTFVFIDAFGFPLFYPYPYYGYYNPSYNYGYGYDDSHRSTVAEVQRRLARAGYYHGAIDGILGPETRRAIRAYERDHKMPAYGVIDRQLLRTLGLS